MEVSLFRKAVLKFLVGFAIFCALWAAVFLLLLRFFPQHSDIIAISFCIGVLFTYFPWFVLTMGATAKAEVKAVSMDVIKDKIEMINTYDLPVVVEKQSDKKYVLTWRYADSKWTEYMSKSGVSHSYKIIVKLNDAKKRATLIEVRRKLKWFVKPTRFKIQGRSFRGISAKYKKGVGWTTIEGFESKEENLKFQPSDLRSPLVNSLLDNGWDVRFGLY